MTEYIPIWQLVSLSAVVGWLLIARFLLMTSKIRSRIQPWVLRQVQTGTDIVVYVQGFQCQSLDVLFNSLSLLLSEEFYTALLPLLFWSGHSSFARRMTFLVALCSCTGNCIKDLVSAPRPQSSRIKRLFSAHVDEEYTLEYGMPSSHVINTMCLSMYFLREFSSQSGGKHGTLLCLVACFVFATNVLVAFGRIYLGMHTPVDIIAGMLIGAIILFIWCHIDQDIDNFITNGANTLPLSSIMSLLLLHMYPRPERETPGFQHYTIFNGVVLGVICGVHRTYLEFHNNNIPTLSLFSRVESGTLIVRLLIGFPIIIIAKLLIRTMSKMVLPALCKLLHVPIHSTHYMPSLCKCKNIPSLEEDNAFIVGNKTVLPLSNEKHFNIDTGIRFLQYASLSWSVVEVVPRVYKYLGL